LGTLWHVLTNGGKRRVCPSTIPSVEKRSASAVRRAGETPPCSPVRRWLVRTAACGLDYGPFLLAKLDRYEQTERLEHRRQFSDAFGVRVGGLTVGLEIIRGAHVVRLTHASFSRRVHRILMVAHDLRDLLPERFLRLGDLKPAVKTVDARVNRLVCRARPRFTVIAGEL
jgi:hypothetical protein